MNWTDEDMQILMKLLPAVKVGVYSGVNSIGEDGIAAVGRICIIAKGGRFAKFNGKDPECNYGNEVDYEALQLLATWPKPRFWLSDGVVCGGLHAGPPKHHPQVGRYNYTEGRIHELCNAWMKRHEILRVPNRETMHKLLKRQKVRLYRSTVPDAYELPHTPDCGTWFPVPVEPALFQL